MWTRALAGLDRHDVEGCEDLLDTYFTQACCAHTVEKVYVQSVQTVGSCMALVGLRESCLTCTSCSHALPGGRCKSKFIFLIHRQ